MKKLCKMLALMLISISLTTYGGCSRTNPSSDVSTEPTEESLVSQIPQTSDSPQISEPPQTSESPVTTDPPRKTIYYITYVLGSSVELWLHGIHQAGIDLDCEIVAKASSYEDIDDQTRLLEEAVATGADAIIVNVVDSEAMAEPVSEAYRSGIPIVLVDVIADTEDYNVCLIIDNVAAGRTASAEMLKKLINSGLSEDDTAEIAVQIGTARSQTARYRLEGFKTYWDEYAPSQWVVLWDDVKVNEGDIGKATEIGHEFLAKYPNLRAMFAPNNGSTVGFVRAIKEANRTDITLVGFDLGEDTREIILSSDFNVSTMMPLGFKLGYDAVMIALELSNGGTVTDKIIDIGVLVVDSENIDVAEAQFWAYRG